jgi:hypothetical protein
MECTKWRLNDFNVQGYFGPVWGHAVVAVEQTGEGAMHELHQDRELALRRRLRAGAEQANEVGVVQIPQQVDLG